METTLQAEGRSGRGKNVARRLRREAIVLDLTEAFKSVLERAVREFSGQEGGGGPWIRVPAGAYSTWAATVHDLARYLAESVAAGLPNLMIKRKLLASPLYYFDSIGLCRLIPSYM